ncbi:MAG TPA: DUF5985 family protein [Acidobacteriaceae bacterium]|nr:DUF5985 family protein [Acidobacteriaceae bacterium]
MTSMAPMTSMLDGFLIGVIVIASLAAGLFFLRFWRESRDSLFLAFSLAFTIEALNRIAQLFSTQSDEGSPWVCLVRAFAFLIIVAGIVHKNRRNS